MGQGAAGKDVPVVILRKELPGLHLRVLADRDAGELIWETVFEDDHGNFQEAPAKRLRSVELVHLEEIINLLRESVRALTPRRRLDLTRLDPPPPAPSEEE